MMLDKRRAYVTYGGDSLGYRRLADLHCELDGPGPYLAGIAWHATATAEFVVLAMRGLDGAT